MGSTGTEGTVFTENLNAEIAEIAECSWLVGRASRETDGERLRFASAARILYALAIAASLHPVAGRRPAPPAHLKSL
jgi:hypothetical protein